MELVDTLDSKSNVARRAGSIPALSTKPTFVGFFFNTRKRQPKGNHFKILDFLAIMGDEWLAEVFYLGMPWYFLL